jgi:hypothetical protein
MLSREQIYTMLMLRKREGNVFSKVPPEIAKKISLNTFIFPDDPDSISKALHHAAYAQQEDVEALLAMLDANPSLLLQAGNVITPGGDELRRVTIYEFLLGAGDYELAEKVQGYFAKITDEDGRPIKDAEEQRIRQYERYQPHIEGMMTQQPYDLSPLIDLIKQASIEDVEPLLKKDMAHESPLRDAMLQFRQDWAPKVLIKPGMHYNYSSLQHAFELLDREWDNLYRTSGNNYDKILLVWRQLIGFEMRRLPGIDRCLMAQGLYYVLDRNEAGRRSYKFKNSSGVFPPTTADDTLDGLGGDFAVNIIGAGRGGRRRRDAGLGYVGRGRPTDIGKLMSHKNIKLAELMQSRPADQQTWCVML